jgi:microcystin-dependent protein
MSTPFMGQIEIFSFVFAPKGWTMCNGQLLPINQNQALFSLLGTTYGGDGRVNFALPDLRSRVPISMGSGGGGNYTLGERGGEEAHTVNISELPGHNHAIMSDVNNGTVPLPASNTVLGIGNGVANPGGTFNIDLYNSTSNPNNTMWAGTIGFTGGSQPHTNIMPYLCLNFCIALQGIFPSQN